MLYFEKGFRPFHTGIIMSVGLIRASKLQAVKVEVLKKSLPLWPFQPNCGQAHSAWLQARPGLNHSQSLMAFNFAAL